MSSSVNEEGNEMVHLDLSFVPSRAGGLGCAGGACVAGGWCWLRGEEGRMRPGGPAGAVAVRLLPVNTELPPL